MNYYNSLIKDVYTEFDSTNTGLSSDRAAKNQSKFGKNYIKRDRNTVLKILISQFSNPLILILMIVVIVSFWTHDHIDGIVILIMIGINAVLGFTQEYRAKKSLDRLQKLIKTRVKVLRDGKMVIVDSIDIVPGDVVLLNKGDYIPADIRLIKTNNLYVNESSLTGESLEVHKDKRITSRSLEPQGIKNSVFQGCFVTQGNGMGIVVAIGKNTFLGRSVDVGNNVSTQTNFLTKLNQFTKILFICVFVITTTSFVINLSLGRDILSSFILGITLALGITPETMPVILSIALSNAAFALSKKKLVIKRPSVFEDLGNMDVICSDKTGTITKGILIPTHYFSPNFKESPEVKLLSKICNANNPLVNFEIMPNSIDDVLAKNTNWDNIENIQTVTKVWDFDFDTRVMAIQGVLNGVNTVIVKGAYEEIVKRSNLASDTKSEVLGKLSEYEKKGYRIIAIAKSEVKGDISDLTHVRKLDLVGFALLIDEPRNNMYKEFKNLKDLQVSLKIITGDSPEITREICQKVGLEVVEDHIVLGSDLEKMDGDKLIEVTSKYNIFARVSPSQKLSIIQSLRAQGHVVGYIGDGINDVGALKIADVGISVDSGVDVAKDCSDLIVLEKDLGAIALGIVEGRKVFANTMKFIFGTMSSSFGNVITITFASLFLKFLPLLPVQVILLDSLTDFQHLAISTDNVDSELISKPRNWDMTIFTKFAVFWGIISTLFDFFHIVVITMVTNSPELFRTTWMLESVFTELISTMSIRTHNWFFKSRPSNALIGFSILPLALTMLFAYTSWGNHLFGLVPVSMWLIIVVIVISLIYFVAMELSKRKYFERFWGVKYQDSTLATQK